MRMCLWCQFYYLRLSDKYWHKGTEPDVSAHNKKANFLIHLNWIFPFGGCIPDLFLLLFLGQNGKKHTHTTSEWDRDILQQRDTQTHKKSPAKSKHRHWFAYKPAKWTQARSLLMVPSVEYALFAQFIFIESIKGMLKFCKQFIFAA